MFINYNDILQKKNDLDSKAQARQHRLQGDAEEFINQLKVSLQLPQGIPLDVNGRCLAYISTGFTNSSGIFQPCSVASIKVNESHILRFLVNVLVNTQVPNGEWITIPVELWYQNRSLIFSCGRQRNHIEIMPSTSPGRFLEAVDDFKEKCIAELSDPNLE